jgi:hypothetical protein
MNHKFSATFFTLLGIGLVSSVLFINQAQSVVASVQTPAATTAQRSWANSEIWWWFNRARPDVNYDSAKSPDLNFASAASNWMAEAGGWPLKAPRTNSAWLSEWDWQAQQDIQARMASEGQEWSPVQGTFKRDLNWSSDWELRWWAFNWNSNRVWVYHVRSKSSGARYTSVVDLNTGRWQKWQSAR